MRRIAALALALSTIAASACDVSQLIRRYEYEEDVYLWLDGTAMVYVSGSVAAINALRGASFNPDPAARVDRAKIRDFYSTPFTHDVRVTTSRRDGRRFVHVRLRVDDVRSLGRAAPFAWSTYRFGRDGDLYRFQQTVGPSVGHDADEGWDGDELVAFRLHLPSRIEYHNAGPENLKRGNILLWEESLVDRLRGQPLTIDARMQTQSILYRTIWLFGVTLVAVALMFAVLIWWISRPETAATGPAGLRGAAATSADPPARWSGTN